MLSATDSTPAAVQAAATWRTSMTRSVGLIGDSNQTIRVFGPISLSGARNSSSDAQRVVTPKRAAKPLRMWNVPP